MTKVIGIGGVFIKVKNPQDTMQWYENVLGLTPNSNRRCSTFYWRDIGREISNGYTILGYFKDDTEYFNPSDLPFMVNLVVNNLEYMLQKLRVAGAHVEREILHERNGRFGYAYDPDGVKLELWEPNGKGPDGQIIE